MTDASTMPMLLIPKITELSRFANRSALMKKYMDEKLTNPSAVPAIMTFRFKVPLIFFLMTRSEERRVGKEC